MGSGYRLKRAIKKYGIHNFSKEILKFFNSQKEALNYESIIVDDDLIKDKNCYNICHGGSGFTVGCAVVKDKYNNRFIVSVNDERYISGEVVPFNKGTHTGRTGGSAYFVNKIYVVDENGNKFICDKTQLNTNYKSVMCNKTVVKDELGNCFIVDKNDERFITGKLHGVTYNTHLSDEHKQKQRNTFKQIKHQQGNKNSQYGKCWIYKQENNEIINKSIHKTELQYYLDNGWIKGRKIK